MCARGGGSECQGYSVGVFAAGKPLVQDEIHLVEVPIYLVKDASTTDVQLF